MLCTDRLKNVLIRRKGNRNSCGKIIISAIYLTFKVLLAFVFNIALCKYIWRWTVLILKEYKMCFKIIVNDGSNIDYVLQWGFVYVVTINLMQLLEVYKCKMCMLNCR